MRLSGKRTPVKRTRSRRWICPGEAAAAHRSAVGFFFILFFAAPPAFAPDEARKLVALLDYLGSDYKNAVQGGKIINQDEFTEMQEFSKRTLELLNKIKETDKADKAGVEPSLKSLADQIENKADPKAV